MGITSHIRVDFSQAAFVESAALVGLRNDLNAIDGGPRESGASTGAGVSLDFMPRRDDVVADAGKGFRTVEITGESAASIDPSGCGPLARFSDDELFAASDSVFGMLDDPAGISGTELLARYDAIGVEISRRESAGASRKDAAGGVPGRPAGEETRPFRVSYPASAVATVEVCHVPRSHTPSAAPEQPKAASSSMPPNSNGFPGGIS